MIFGAGKFEINSSQPDEIDLSTQLNVITLCDHEQCPTNKSSNRSNTMIVVRSDGNLQSIKAGGNHSDDGHNQPLESPAVGVLLR